MQVADFNFNLPPEHIADYPAKQRSACRLLSLDGGSGQTRHGVFTDILAQLNPGDLLVFNNTRVIPARLYGHKASGGRLEMLVERLLDNQRVLAHIRASKAPPPGSQLYLGDDSCAGAGKVTASVLARHGQLFEVRFDDPRPLLTILEHIGHIPLPPYIKRPDQLADRERYQTVYSQRPGAVAAPTAGLHFDPPLLQALREKGVEMAFVTLHVATGTFQPVRVSQVEQHSMHAEYAEVSEQVVQAVLSCKARGNKVVAVGTTSVRSLESAAQAALVGHTIDARLVDLPSPNTTLTDQPPPSSVPASSTPSSTPPSAPLSAQQPPLLVPFAADTRIFIYPGYRFRVIDALITNFHLPQSTLLMLVCAFAGYRHVMHAYQQAIQSHYRFFSYGDAMYITYNPQAPDERPGDH